MRSWGLSSEEQDEVWVRWRQGESLRLIARRLGKRGPSVRAFVLQTGGVQHCPPRRAERCLSMAEREEISRGVAAGEPCRQIAARLGRAPSTVSRELARKVAATTIGPRPPTPPPSGGPSGPRRPSWRSSHGCGRWWRPSWPCGGHPSRSPAGCRWPTLKIRCCGCRTRRSTCRCSSRAAGRCAASSSAVCARAGDALSARQAPTPGPRPAP